MPGAMTTLADLSAAPTARRNFVEDRLNARISLQHFGALQLTKFPRCLTPPIFRGLDGGIGHGNVMGGAQLGALFRG